jgi:hypothetical protein
MGRIYVNSFQPLCSTGTGRKVVARFGLPAFIDGSCRREPDFEAAFPALSALCRGGLFAPKLRAGDTVIYLTKKQALEGLPAHRRLVAILEVMECFDSHEEAAAWYRSQMGALPSNCLVPDNPPVAWEHTHQNPILPPGVAPNLTNWNAKYEERASLHPQFRACRPVFLDLHRPAVLTDETLRAVFVEYGRIPGTQNPAQIPAGDYERLRQLARKHAETIEAKR